MRGIKYLTLLVTLLISVTMQGQFNPDNPIEPGYYHTLRLTATPSDGGSFNYSSGTSIAAGREIYLGAYSSTGYVFKCWKENGKVISTDSYFYYKMPNRDASLTAEFEFSPTSPDEPSLNQYSRIYVMASPSEAGHFNISSGSEFKVGTTISIDAYSYGGYEFKEWTEDGITISTTRWLSYYVKEGNHTLVAHYVFNPNNPDEPSKPEDRCGIYGFSVNGERGNTVSLPVYLENNANVFGTAVDIRFPEGFNVFKDKIAFTNRVSDQKLDVSDLGNNTYRISLIGTKPFNGLNGKLFEVPVMIPDTAGIERIYTVELSNGEIHSSDSVTKNAPVRNGFIYVNKTMLEYTMQLNLPKGWSWISSSFDDPQYMYLKDFIKPIENNVERIVGYDAEVIRDPQYGLSGNLKSLLPTEGYMIKTDSKINNSWAGNAYLPKDVTLHLHKGWNWIGYVPTFELPVTDALGNLTPAEGDVIKDHDNFATYSNGKWTGTLSVMTPARGYMYHSSADISFKYPSVNKAAASENMCYDNEEVMPWHIDRNAYPFNMSVIAQLRINNVPVSDDRFIVGAFVGNECRGIGIYIDNLLFITIYGDENKNEQITFRALDTSLSEVCQISETAIFGNKLMGSINSPMTMTVNEPTGITSADNDRNNDICFDSENNIIHVTGLLSNVKHVSVISNTGIIMTETSQYDAYGINISSLPCGTYIVTINTNEGVIVKKILKVK